MHQTMLAHKKDVRLGVVALSNVVDGVVPHHLTFRSHPNNFWDPVSPQTTI